jgi:tRNA (guanine37-N1)-methyltransferase
MKIEILTIFPQMFKGPLSQSLLKRAQEKKLVEIKIHDLRLWARDKHKTVDDKPFGGGPGMILRVDVVDRALRNLGSGHKILLSPQGKKLNQKLVQKLSQKKHLILVCGHYEGFDERVRSLVKEEISIGDYILTGGEIPAMVLIDAVVRLVPGVLGDEDSLKEESFSQPSGGLEYPQYTRPAEYHGKKVPAVLLSGNHEAISQWRKNQARKRTKSRRPDLEKLISANN